MDNDSKNKLKDVLSTIDPVEFKWDEASTTVGVIAQDVPTGDLYDIGMNTMGSIDLTNIGLSNGITTIGGSGGGSGQTYTIGSSLPGNITYNTNSTLSAGDTVYGKTTIKTAKNEIDIDELANMMEVLKKRLLIIAPNFEMHEKYPMLKEMYNEYKAMEKLLGGPDSLDEK